MSFKKTYLLDSFLGTVLRSIRFKKKSIQLLLVILFALAVTASFFSLNKILISPSTTLDLRSNASTMNSPTIYSGVYIKDVPGYNNMQPLYNFQNKSGKGVSVYMFYTGWGNQYNQFPTTNMNLLRSNGSIPEITWEPWAYIKNDPKYSLSSIIRGDHDAYIKQFASDAKAWKYPFFLRFAQEMNGDWYPWSENILYSDGTKSSPGDFAKAWRHVHDVFDQVYGSTPSNVTWIWSPNEEYSGSIPLTGLYPGDNYVDWTGMDAYNGPNATSPWRSFSEIFKPLYDKIQTIAPSKPVMVAETAAREYGDGGYKKGEWIKDAYRQPGTASFPNLKAVTWFNELKETNWLIESSSFSQAGYTAAMSTEPSASFYASNSFGNLTEYTKVEALVTTQTVTPTLTTTPAGSVITIYTAGTPAYGVYPNLDLYVGGKLFKSFTNIQGEPLSRIFKTLTTSYPSKVSADQIKLVFTNDVYDSNTGDDRNLLVDKINIDGVDYQTEAANVYSVGSWDSGSGCGGGYKKSEWLYCSNGYFQYAYTNLTTITVTSTPTSVGTDTVPPVVLITNPIEGSILNKNTRISFNATATDSSGVAKVVFYIYGSSGNLLAMNTATSAPYSYTWRTPNKEGNYTLVTQAYDNKGNSAAARISFTAK